MCIYLYRERATNFGAYPRQQAIKGFSDLKIVGKDVLSPRFLESCSKTYLLNDKYFGIFEVRSVSWSRARVTNNSDFSGRA